MLKGPNQLTRWSQAIKAWPPPGRTMFAWEHLGHCVALILLPRIHIYFKKNLRKFLSHLVSVGFSANMKKK